MRRKTVAIIGASNPTPQEKIFAYEVGRLLGREGILLITGGLGGVMEAASKGAKDSGADVIGIIPGLDPDQANPWVDIVLATGLGDARNVIIASSADVIIAIGGGFGTLSEIAFGLKRSKPIVGLLTWGLDLEKTGGIDLIRASDPQEAVKIALRYVKGG
jgi:hypothetical protein